MGLIWVRADEDDECRRRRLLRPCRLSRRLLLRRGGLDPSDSSELEPDSVLSSEELDWDEGDDERDEGELEELEDGLGSRRDLRDRSTVLRAAPR